MKLQLKRSNVLDGANAKSPTPSQMEYGEIAVNYNTNDPAIFIKDSNDNIIRVAGSGAEGTFSGDYNDLTNKPTIGDGTITINNADGSENATFTVNQSGDTTVTLPAGFSGDYNDLDNKPTIGDGTITINNSDGSENATFTVNQSGDTTVTLPEGFSGDYNDLDNLPVIGDAQITIEQNSVTLGTFTVNQAGDATITLPDSATIYPPSTDEPGGPSNGDIWIDTNECPPVLKIWSDCDGDGKWWDLTDSEPKPINPQPDDGNNDITPTPPGSGTQVDPYILTAVEVNYEAAESIETISISNQKIGELVQFIDNNSGTNGARSSTNWNY